MSRLLVSARNLAEARIAAAAGVDLIDLKEPAHGALGAVAEETLDEVARELAERVPLSAALGELLEVEPARLAKAPPALSFAKLGLAGCARVVDWSNRLAAAMAMLPDSIGRVAVCYADARRADSPQVEAVIDTAAQLGCRALLVDTFAKDSGGLLDWWSLDDLRRALDRARGAKLIAVVGGSLTLDTIARVLPLEPDYIAVRGAACAGSRNGPLDPTRVGQLVKLFGARRGENFAQAAPAHGSAAESAKLVDNGRSAPNTRFFPMSPDA